MSVYRPVLAFWFNIGALGVALLGIGLSYCQLRRSSSASEAAQEAAEDSLEAVQRSAASLDIPRLTDGLRLVETMIRREKYEMAKYIIEMHLRPDLVRLSKLELFSEKTYKEKMSNMKTKVTLVRDALKQELRYQEPEQSDKDWVETEQRLSEVADQLEEWAEEERFPKKGGENDT